MFSKTTGVLDQYPYHKKMHIDRILASAAEIINAANLIPDYCSYKQMQQQSTKKSAKCQLS